MIPEKKGSPSPLSYISAGFEFVAVFLLFTGGGWSLDIHSSWGKGSPGGWMLAGIFLGLIAGTWILYRYSRLSVSSRTPAGEGLREDTKDSQKQNRRTDSQKIQNLSKDINDLNSRLHKTISDNSSS